VVIFDGHKLITVTELRHNTSKITKEVEEGQSYLIFRHNKPVAALVSIEDYERLQASDEQVRWINK